MAFRNNYWTALLFFWAAVIFVVSVIPGEDLPSLSIWEPDKVMHALVYAILSFLTFKVMRRNYVTFSLSKTIFIAAGLCISFGFIIEMIQRLLPTRSFDLLDVFANTTGCFISLSVLWLTNR